MELKLRDQLLTCFQMMMIPPKSMLMRIANKMTTKMSLLLDHLNQKKDREKIQNAFCWLEVVRIRRIANVLAANLL